MAGSSVKIDTKQLNRLAKSLKSAGVKYERGTTKLLKKIGALVQGVARSYSPESPTIAMYARANKSGVTKRKRSNITTGSLRDSIKMKATKEEASIFIASNSRAGKYAEKMHDQKGTAWRERGKRTEQKGSKADDKFIDRAYADNVRNIDELIDDVLDDFINAI